MTKLASATMFGCLMSLSTALHMSPLHKPLSSVPEQLWRAAAADHRSAMLDLLYPPSSSLPSKNGGTTGLKDRIHAVSRHPVYNFLHVYYRYSVGDILCYSPGMGKQLEGVSASDLQDKTLTGMEHTFAKTPLLRRKFLKLDSDRASFALDASTIAEAKAFDLSAMISSREILARSATRAPFFGCYGLHEWAMLYSGGESGYTPERHQSFLSLRVSQRTIDEVVQGGVRCTHFDAFRFFQPAARRFNLIDPITKERQRELEQPGCVHANMVGRLSCLACLESS